MLAARKHEAGHNDHSRNGNKKPTPAVWPVDGETVDRLAGQAGSRQHHHDQAWAPITSGLAEVPGVPAEHLPLP